MTELKRLILSIVIALQIPVAYYLNGHDLFVRANGVGGIYILTIYVFCVFYLYFKFFVNKPNL
jgi:hypothetical protein